MNLVYTSGLDSVESPRFFNPEADFFGQKHPVQFIAFQVYLSHSLRVIYVHHYWQIDKSMQLRLSELKCALNWIIVN